MGGILLESENISWLSIACASPVGPLIDWEYFISGLAVIRSVVMGWKLKGGGAAP